MKLIHKISKEKFYEDCKALADTIDKSKYDSIYGIPNGGFRVAILIGNYLGLNVVLEPHPQTLIVDDLIDSGVTIEKYSEYDTACLYSKPHSPKLLTYDTVECIDGWIEFYYENTAGDKEDLITRIIEHIGEDPTREGLIDTPKRVVRMWDEIFGGYNQDSDELFKAVFESDTDEMVIVRDIPFYSHCEHHMVPFFGKVHIGYIPNGKVLGLSKFARLVEVFAKRMQIQENLTTQIADTIERELKPLGVMVVIRAEHLCMSMRGVKKPGSNTVTSAIRGKFKESQEARNEFLQLIRIN